MKQWKLILDKFLKVVVKVSPTNCRKQAEGACPLTAENSASIRLLIPV